MKLYLEACASMAMLWILQTGWLVFFTAPIWILVLVFSLMVARP